MKISHIIVVVTTSSKAEAERVTQSLLEARLIACANIVGPVQSLFHWSGKINKAEEYLILMKSRKGLFGKLSAVVKASHSYDVPEIIALPIIDGSKPYLDWLSNCLS